MDKKNITVTMSMEDYESMKADKQFWKNMYYRVTKREYIEIINLEPEPDKENLEIKFFANQFIQDNIEHFGEELEGFENRIDKIIIK
jgi:hypothetical protein